MLAAGVVIALDVFEDFEASIAGVVEATDLEHFVLRVPIKDSVQALS